MYDEVLPGFYRIIVPLPRNPLKELNSYVIKGKERTLIIDTGMNREECISAMSAGLQELQVDLSRTDFFITHLHADHYGLVGTLATESSKVYLPKPDADILIAEPGIWETYAHFAVKNGFPELEVQKAIQNHPGVKYSVKKWVKFHHLYDGDTLQVGDYTLKCIETPGHTPGHECLYDAANRLFIAGDHVLGDITPNISSFDTGENPLKEYLRSLDKVYNYDVKLVLPGHRTFFTTFRERIDELKRHHEVRANEALTILQADNNKTAYQVASKMTWDMVGEWDSFPVAQKWFATGEALAHLKYLEDEGKIHRRISGEKVIFSAG